MPWNLTLIHTVTGDTLKWERFTSRAEAELRRVQLEELLASAHCTTRFLVRITQAGSGLSAQDCTAGLEEGAGFTEAEVPGSVTRNPKPLLKQK